MKRLLLIAPVFFGYYKDMILEAEELGYHVDYLCDAPSNSNISKALGRINKKLISGSAKRYYNEKALPLVEKEQYDKVLLVAGMTCAFASDMFCEMRLFALLQKIGEEKKAPSYTEILKNATLNGARLMGFRNCGSIVVGGDADLIVIDVSKANMLPMTNFADNIVMSCNSGNVVTTIVGGKILYDHGRYFIGDNSSEIQSRMEQIKNRILGA